MKASTTVVEYLSQALQAGASPGAPLRLREHKKQETFRALQSAARRLVSERGLDNVTIDEIADAAMVSKRTFFNYFDSKEAAIVETEPRKVERLAASLAARPVDETCVQALREATIVHMACYARDLQELTELVCANPSLIGPQVQAFAPFQKVIIEWAAARTGVDPEIDFYPELLARTTSVMLNMTVRRWHPDSGTEGFIQLASEIYAQLTDGLAAR